MVTHGKPELKKMTERKISLLHSVCHVGLAELRKTKKKKKKCFASFNILDDEIRREITYESSTTITISREGEGWG